MDASMLLASCASWTEPKRWPNQPHTERQKMTEENKKPSIDKAHEWLDSVLTAVDAIPEVNDESVRRDLARCAHLLRVAIAEERFNFVPF